MVFFLPAYVQEHFFFLDHHLNLLEQPYMSVGVLDVKNCFEYTCIPSEIRSKHDITFLTVTAAVVNTHKG